MQKSIKRTISILLSILMVVSLFVAVPITASAATQDDIFKLAQNMQRLVEEYSIREDYDSVDMLDSAAKYLMDTFQKADMNPDDPGVERAYNVALAVYDHYTGSGSGDVTSVTEMEIIELVRALDALTQNYSMQGDHTPAHMLDSLSHMLMPSVLDPASLNDPKVVSAYNLALTINNIFNGSDAPTYTVTWKDDDGNLIGTTRVEEGVAPTHADPVKKTDIKYTYTFTGWYDSDRNFYAKGTALPAVTGDTFFIAVFTEAPIYYEVGDSINFGDSTYVEGANYGESSMTLSGAYTIVSATFDSNNYSYNMILQSGENTVELSAKGDEDYENFAVKVICGEDTYYSPYQFEIVQKGTVIWKDEDGNILETDENVPDGSTPSFDGEYSKESESPEDYYYVTRWFKEDSDGNINEYGYELSKLYAYFNGSEIIFRGKLIKVKYLKPGVMFSLQEGVDAGDSYVMPTPESYARQLAGLQIVRELSFAHQSGDTYIYNVGIGDNGTTTTNQSSQNESLGDNLAWKCIDGDGSQDTPYIFDVVSAPTYTVTWKNWNGDVLETDENVAEGTTPTYDGAIPTKDGCTFTGWTDGDNTYGLNDALPGVTADVTYIAVFTYSDGIGASLAGYSISLEGDIAVNFYMEIAPEVVSHEGAYMQFTVPDTSKEYQDQKIYIKDLEPVIIGDKTYYVFKCKVAAKDMASEITSQLIDGDKASTVYTYSVKGYADYLIEHQDDSQTFKDAVPLVEAMLQYGTYANNYFSDANALEALDVDIPAKEAAVNDLPEGLTFEGATLSLKSQTTLSLYFISEQQLTLSMDGKTEGVDYELAHNGSEYVIRIRNISAAELNDDFTVTYTSNGQGGTVTYSPMIYCYKAANSQAADVKLKNVVKALYRYWFEAAQYFNKNQGGN